MNLGLLLILGLTLSKRSGIANIILMALPQSFPPEMLRQRESQYFPSLVSKEAELWAGRKGNLHLGTR